MMDAMSRCLTAAEVERIVDDKMRSFDRAALGIAFHVEHRCSAVVIEESLHVERIGDVLIIRRGVI